MYIITYTEQESVIDPPYSSHESYTSRTITVDKYFLAHNSTELEQFVLKAYKSTYSSIKIKTVYSVSGTVEVIPTVTCTIKNLPLTPNQN